MLSSVFVSCLIVAAMGVYAMESTRYALNDKEVVLEDSIADMVDESTTSRVKEQLRKSAVAEADYIDQSFVYSGEAVQYLADNMTYIMQHKDQYLPCELPDTRIDYDIMSGMPYIYYSPDLVEQGISPELMQEIAIANNISVNMRPMGKPYLKYHASIFAGSKNGYLICVDIVPHGGKVFPSRERQELFNKTYDPRQRPWYKLAVKNGKMSHTEAYIGEDSFLEMSCVAPYYDENGFAGVVGIGSSIEDIHEKVLNTSTGKTGFSFTLDSNCNVVFSSREYGMLQAVPEVVDIRTLGEPTLAEAADHMVAGETDVREVVVDGTEYYLAYAPMSHIGWSFGTLIGKDEVLAPGDAVATNIRHEMNNFKDVLQDIFASTILKAALLLIPVLLLIIFACRSMTSMTTLPIRRLTAEVKQISGGKLDKKLDINTGDEIEGLAQCFNKMTDDLQLYIEHLSTAVAEKERVQTELKVASRIQEGMLPDNLDENTCAGRFGISAFMQPAKAVGGDFYDYYFIDDDNVAVTVADVSDKGVPAALFMVITKTLLKNYISSITEQKDLARIVNQVNNTLVISNREFMFVTAFIGILNISSGRFDYVNAGHNPPLVRTNGSFEYLEKADNPMLGIKKGIDYKIQSLTLRRGDALFIYTDGVTEAKDETNVMFSENRLRQVLNDVAIDEIQAEHILAPVRDAVKKHSLQVDQFDDITMMSLVYLMKDEGD
ncbi:MAG: SpoIIE family protein phosphatase [Anaerovibrio sp.]|uniref:SpoIIE family protein phosphatase n=1 Tax=Anaerovibrio sp. TaxID=1872532 RepID=UPI0025EEF028|nr:SpoIIE family protein phosphatase [Anaerovibrio sp.]MCR5175509.1 SpoIIE family protein phosphatase [Anaerovibrio sp.]